MYEKEVNKFITYVFIMKIHKMQFHFNVHVHAP